MMRYVKRLLLFLVRLVTIVGVAEVVRESQRRQEEQVESEANAGSETAGSARVDRIGWSRPKPEHTPPPTYWPAVVGLGVMFFTWGIISNLFVLSVGLLFLVAGLTGWIGDLLSEG